MKIDTIKLYGSAGSFEGEANAHITGCDIIISGCDRVEKARALLGASSDLLDAAKRAMTVLEGIVTIRREGDTLAQLAAAIAKAEA